MTTSDQGFPLDDAGFPTSAGADPFGSSAGHAASSDDDYEEFPNAPAPIGVLPAIVTAGSRSLEKDGKKYYIVEFECTDPRFTGCDKQSIFFDMGEGRQRDRYAKVCSALGFMVRQTDDGSVKMPKPTMLVSRNCLVVYSDYVHKGDGQLKPTIAWGYPKDSAAFNKWASESSLTDAQKKRIKDSVGVLPPGPF